MSKNKKAIIILSGGMKQDGEGNWISTDLIEADKNIGSPGGKIRVIAASYLYQKNSKQYIYATGGQGYDMNVQGVNHPNLSEVIKNELIELGVPPQKITKESKSNNTYQQLKASNKIAEKENFQIVAMISVGYHLPRVKAMIKHRPELNFLNGMLKDNKLILQSAEEILIKYNSKKWKRQIEQAYKTPKMKEIIKQEKIGVEQVKKGIYKFV
jgi:hypothetical protein